MKSLHLHPILKLQLLQLSLPLLGLTVNYSSLLIQTWTPGPTSSSLVHPKVRVFNPITKPTELSS